MPAYGSRRACAECPRARRTRSRAGRTLKRGGPRSREAHPLERGGARPREARVLERGETYSRESSSGPPGGPLGPSRRGPCPAWLSKAYLVLALLRVLSGDFPVVLRGPLGLSPTRRSQVTIWLAPTKTRQGRTHPELTLEHTEISRISVQG
jgi:hypothetical protein